MALNQYRPSFNQDDIQKSGQRKRIKHGWFKFRTTKAGTGVNADSANMFMTVTCAPVDPENNSKGPTIRHMLTLPFKTPTGVLKEAGLPDDAQTDIPDTVGFLIQWLLATEAGLLPEQQRIKNFGSKKKPDWKVIDAEGNPTGEELAPKDQRDQTTYERKQAAFEYFADAWESPEKLVAKEFYGKVGAKGEYDNILELRAELPADATLEEEPYAAPAE